MNVCVQWAPRMLWWEQQRSRAVGWSPNPYPVPKKSHLPSPSWVCPKPATAATAGSMQGTAGPVSYRHCIPKGCCSMGGVHGFIKQPELFKLQLLKGQTPASRFHRKCSVCLFGPLQPRNLLCLSTQSYKPTARVTGALQGWITSAIENHSFWDVHLPFFLKTPTCAFYETVIKNPLKFLRICSTLVIFNVYRL